MATLPVTPLLMRAMVLHAPGEPLRLADVLKSTLRAIEMVGLESMNYFEMQLSNAQSQYSGALVRRTRLRGLCRAKNAIFIDEIFDEALVLLGIEARIG